MALTERASSSLQGNRSASDLVNLVRQLQAAREDNGAVAEAEGVGDAGFVDVLQTTGLWYSDKEPAPIELESGFVVDRDHEIFARAQHRQRVKRLYDPTEEISELQRELLQLAVDQLGEAVANLDIAVIHTVRSLNPSFVAALEDAVARTDRHGNHVQCRPIYTLASRNDHSGGHYTPAYNRFLAKVFLEWLQAYL